MTHRRSRVLPFLLALASAVAGVFAALIYAAARSDFRLRGCHEMPEEDWVHTANCLDGAGAMRVLGIAVLVLGGLFVWSVWRLRNV